MKQRIIMFVDDDERLILGTKKIFERLGSSVLSASGGEQALALLEEHAVDVIFMDVNMPGMDGLETLAEVKKQYPLVEVIMITGSFTREQAAEGLRLGAYDFLLKPVSISDFVKKADEAFNKRKAMEEKLRIASQ